MSATARLGTPGQFLSGMESTGHYWLNLYYALKEHGFHPVVVNPLTTAHISQGHIRKTKTDPASARSATSGTSSRPRNWSLLRAWTPAPSRPAPSQAQEGKSPTTPGRGYLRRSLWVAALVAFIKNPALRPFYLRLRRGGKHHLLAVTATARKLTHVAWRILRDNRPFDAMRTA